MMESLLRAEKISKTFRKGLKKIPVLHEVDVEIKRAEMVAIVGASGAGKSTLLHILGTLEAPSRGKVFFEKDEELTSYREAELSHFRNRKLGFVFQFHHLLPEFSAIENVMMPGLIAGHGKRTCYAQAEQLLDFVGLKERLGHRPSELSGGEQQRVAVARAVILRPSLILADELTGNLDSENSRKVIELLIQLNKEMGVGVLLVTHDQALASRMHRTLEMKDGRLCSINDKS